MHSIESYTEQNIDKNSYAMHTVKMTPNLLFEYQCTSGKLIRLSNRIESKLFCPNWNAVGCWLLAVSWWRSTVVERRSVTSELSLSCARPAADG